MNNSPKEEFIYRILVISWNRKYRRMPKLIIIIKKIYNFEFWRKVKSQKNSNRNRNLINFFRANKRRLNGRGTREIKRLRFLGEEITLKTGLNCATCRCKATRSNTIRFDLNELGQFSGSALSPPLPALWSHKLFMLMTMLIVWSLWTPSRCLSEPVHGGVGSRRGGGGGGKKEKGKKRKKETQLVAAMLMRSWH